NHFRETSASNYQKAYNRFYKIANPVKLTLKYIDEMIYESYLLYHNVYILMIFHFNIRNKTFIDIKDGLLIIKSLKQNTDCRGFRPK
ncbi:MAG: hypothetical protein LBB84_08905, partial [Tannerellaceae bacterium]|nr:hypothetical protein [Tannerellaceae bacterium]